MPFNAIFVSLFIYACLFNPWFIDVAHIQRHSFFKSLISPQLYFLLVFFIFLFKVPTVRGFIRQNLSHAILKNILIGAAYALITPLIALLVVCIYSYLQFANGSNLFIPWEGHAYCPYTTTDLFFLWILAPISEELFFRGLLFPALKQKYSLHLAVFLSALLFMSTHGMYHLGSLVLGIAMAYASHYHKSLWPAISYHVLANAYIPILCWCFPNALNFFEKYSKLFFAQ